MAMALFADEKVAIVLSVDNFIDTAEPLLPAQLADSLGSPKRTLMAGTNPFLASRFDTELVLAKRQQPFFSPATTRRFAALSARSVSSFVFRCRRFALAFGHI